MQSLSLNMQLSMGGMCDKVNISGWNDEGNVIQAISS
jgi:hypothetical protein